MNEDSSVGHFDNGSTITAEKILVSTKHLRIQPSNIFDAFAEIDHGLQSRQIVT
jgi:hypothetical protein